MKKFTALALVCLLMFSLCSCTKYVVELVFDEPPAQEVVAPLPAATEPPTTEAPTTEAPATEPSAAPNVNTGN